MLAPLDFTEIRKVLKFDGIINHYIIILVPIVDDREVEATEDFCAIIEMLDYAGKCIDISEPEACVNITDYDRRLDGILKLYAHCLPNV